jgi:regulator of nucleoside diphosphate kinase
MIRNSVFPEIAQNEKQKNIAAVFSQNGDCIYVTSTDLQRLSELLKVAKSLHSRDRGDLAALEVELKRAIIVHAKEIPADVITMNSQAELFDVDTEEKVIFTVVFPEDANVDQGRISVLAPLGAAMLGYRVGDEFEWKVPYGLRRFKVTKVHYQPEAAGQNS